MAESRAEHIAQLAELITDVEVAMFTTTGVDGRLYSRPLATQQVAFEGALWFVITAASPKPIATRSSDASRFQPMPLSLGPLS
ncbi:hypothetical protein G6F66_015066 [Rhizopus arrhizus]|nr:hypothetical protein G6F66_015066 [Rhizopus arrhizus]